MPTKWQPSTSSTSKPPVLPKHTRLGSLSAERPHAPSADQAEAHALAYEIIRRQSAERGVVLSDVWDERAPWRTDDSLMSPQVWEDYKMFPQITESLRKHGDATKVTPEDVREYERYLSLARFGELETNAWRLMKRIAGQKKNSRVSDNDLTQRAIL